MKPHCEETLAELSTYLDGELTEEIRAKIAVHLDDCPPCGDIAGFEVELRRVIAPSAWTGCPTSSGRGS